MKSSAWVGCITIGTRRGVLVMTAWQPDAP